MGIKSIFSRILEGIFPSDIKCVSCGKDIFEDYDKRMCKTCLAGVRLIDDKFCSKCGRPITGEGDYCLTCQNTEYTYGICRAPFTYSGTILKLVRRLKYDNGLYIAEYFANAMANTYKRMPEADIIIPVPMHSSRNISRFTNHAEAIAKALSSKIGVPMMKGNLVRTKDTAPLEGHNPQERKDILQGAFALNDRSAIKGKKILLVDDVYTTGATADTCATLLIKKGALEVNILTASITEYKLKSITEGDI